GWGGGCQPGGGGFCGFIFAFYGIATAPLPESGSLRRGSGRTVAQPVIDRQPSGAGGGEEDEEHQDEDRELQRHLGGEEALLAVYQHDGAGEDRDLDRRHEPSQEAEAEEQASTDMGDDDVVGDGPLTEADVGGLHRFEERAALHREGDAL